MNTFTKLTAAASIALLTASGAIAQTAGPLDADGDDFLTEAEFAPAADMGMVFAAVDSDGDGLVSEVEFNEAARDFADEDDDNNLSVQEFDRVDELTRMFEGGDTPIDSAAADTDGDGMISAEEEAAARGM